MQAVCSPLDTSQLLRDILKSKEKHFDSSSSSNNGDNSSDNSTNSNSSSGGSSILIKHSILPLAASCEAEMISPLLHSKSGSMAYSDRDGHDKDVDADHDGNNANASISNMSNNSSFSGKYQSRMDFDDGGDDDEDRSQDLSINRRNAISNNDDDDDDDDNNSSDRRILKIPVSSSPQDETETTAGSSEWESKEAKRAHVENILSSMRQSPPPASLAGSEDASGDPSPTGNAGKRQKRKQPQPQQHDTSVSSIEDQQLHFQVDQKRSRRDRSDSSPAGAALDASSAKIAGGAVIDTFSVNGGLDEPIVDDSDTDVEDSAEDLAKSFSGQSANNTLGDKRAGVDHILNGLQASAAGNSSSALASPSGESSKKQKRKQTQPQQHENSHMSGTRDDRRPKFDDNHNKSGNNHNAAHFFGFKHSNTPESSILNAGHLPPDHNMANFMGADALLRKSLFRGMNERDFIPPYHGGLDPNLFRENLFRQSLFGLRPDLDPMAAFRNLPKTVHGFPDPLLSPEEQSKLPTAAELVKIASVLKTELKQAVNKAIDNAVSKVLNEKQLSATNADRASHVVNSGHEQQHQSQQQQQQQQQTNIDRQNQSRPKSVPSPKLLPNFLLPHHPLHHNLPHPQQHQLSQQHLHHPHQQLHQLSQRSSPSLPVNPASELESAKENVDSAAANSQQCEKKPELIVPFSDHLHILEKFGNRLHQQQQQHHPLHHQQQQQQEQDKLSAFDPVPRGDREGDGQQPQLITPHTGPTMTFHPHLPYYLPALPPGLYPGMTGTGMEPEQTEALPLIVSTPKKKRTKVTDTRLSSPRGNTTTTNSASTTPNSNAPSNNNSNQCNGNNNNSVTTNNNNNNNNNNSKPSLLQDNTPSSSSMDNMDSLAQRHQLVAAAAAAAAASSFPHFLPPVLPTSVAITNPSLNHSDLLTLRLREAGFPDARIPSPSDHGRVSTPRSANESPHFMSKLELYERTALSMPGDHLMDMGGPGAPHPISFSDIHNIFTLQWNPLKVNIFKERSLCRLTV
ncbi:hypothetical protein ElyMa_003850400 [Elysia marginata]|uniref:Prospero domain-containing protein n=1 Tax=Elysia marginata TaxID=1093978 RepID=A0AAV4FHQ4_9GAST|nr:hypothetical protein ElyMa_003850400 [Elysia marginata]